MCVLCVCVCVCVCVCCGCDVCVRGEREGEGGSDGGAVKRAIFIYKFTVPSEEQKKDVISHISQGKNLASDQGPRN